MSDMGLERKLSELKQGESGMLIRLDLPDDMAQRLMQMGFVPGMKVEAALSAPGGDPRVYRVDGAEVGLRRETSEFIWVT